MIVAQQQLDFQDIIRALGPRSGVELVYDILLYIIFLFCVIAMFMQSDKQMITTMLFAAAAALAVVAKLDVIEARAFGALVVNAGVFVLPIIGGGITKAKKSVPLGIIAGVLGGIYFFMFWLISQRG